LAHKKNYKVKKGEVIFKEGDPVTGIFFVNTGIVKVHKRWGADKELILRFAKEAKYLGTAHWVVMAYIRNIGDCDTGWNC
jgi:CRP-like cAMP-binding protein